MTFLAECPYCRRKVRVPEHAAGGTHECRRCGNSYTLVEEVPLRGAAPPSALTPAETPQNPVWEAPGPAVLTVASSAQPQTHSESPSPLSPSFEEATPGQGWGRRFGLAPLSALALCCASLALVVAGLVPSVWWPLALTTLGLLLSGGGALACLKPTGGHIAWPLATTLANLVLFVLTLLAPTVLGGRLADAWPTPRPETARTIHVPIGVPKGAGTEEIGEGDWVDARRETVQQGEVRIRVRHAAIQPAEPRTVTGTRRSSEKVLALVVRVHNLGTSRRVDFGGWTHASLRDTSGKNYPLKSQSGHRPGAISLAPLKWADETLLFEAPLASVEELRLELPGSAFGGQGSVRFRIPRAMFVSRS